MKPHIYVVGIGPGSLQGMTLEAKAVLEGCDCIVGYHTYIDLIRDYFPDKEFVVTGMTQEVARCRLVLERALQGQNVAIVSSGDAGIYGMAGIMHEVAADTPDVEIDVIPGVTAASAGAALLGAPLIADTCLISLSDLLTPWDKIANRLDCAAAGDFVICLYNPASKKRSDYLEKACDIICATSRPIRRRASSATSAAMGKKSPSSRWANCGRSTSICSARSLSATARRKS